MGKGNPHTRPCVFRIPSNPKCQHTTRAHSCVTLKCLRFHHATPAWKLILHMPPLRQWSTSRPCRRGCRYFIAPCLLNKPQHNRSQSVPVGACTREHSIRQRIHRLPVPPTPTCLQRHTHATYTLAAAHRAGHSPEAAIKPPPALALQPVLGLLLLPSPYLSGA